MPKHGAVIRYRSRRSHGPVREGATRCAVFVYAAICRRNCDAMPPGIVADCSSARVGETAHCQNIVYLLFTKICSVAWIAACQCPIQQRAANLPTPCFILVLAIPFR